MAKGWGKLYREGLHGFYLLPGIMRLIRSQGLRLRGTCDAHGRNSLCVKVQVLVGMPEDHRQLGGPRPAWKNNIRKDHEEAGGECVDWCLLAQVRVEW